MLGLGSKIKYHYHFFLTKYLNISIVKCQNNGSWYLTNIRTMRFLINNHH